MTTPLTMFQGTAHMTGGEGAPGSTVEPFTDIARFWSRRKTVSEFLKKNHQSDWTNYWRWYLAWVERMNDPLDWWRNNAPDPEAFKVIETLLPKHILGMFLSQEWFTVKGRERQDAEYARIVQSLLMYMVDRNDLFPKIYECMKYCLIMGHAWGKVTWRVEVEDRVRDTGEPVFDAESGQMTGVRRKRVTDSIEIGRAHV